jgi:nitroreductase
MSSPKPFDAVTAHPAAEVSDTAEEAIVSRRSVRGFLTDPVPMALVRHILEVSARAPSGTNMQPWQGHVVVGRKRQELCDAVVDASLNDRGGHEREYKYYPDKFFEPYLTRRRTVGFGMYDLLGIKKGDVQRMKEQGAKNFTFFDAPVGMIFTIDKRLEIGSWLDYGMYLQNIMTVARQYGLHTCPQAAWPSYHTIIKRILEIPDGETVVCGMALGYEDTSLPENTLRTERAALDDHITFHED